jgi:hypothetical protein
VSPTGNPNRPRPAGGGWNPRGNLERRISPQAGPVPLGIATESFFSRNGNFSSTRRVSWENTVIKSLTHNVGVAVAAAARGLMLRWIELTAPSWSLCHANLAVI